MVAPTWLLGGAVVAFLFAPSATRTLALFPGLLPDGAGFDAVVVAVCVAFALLLFASVLLHELAHAWTARRFGHRVDAVVLSAWGGHTSYDGHGATPAGHLLIALAGPATNLALAGALRLVQLAVDGPVTSLLGLAALMLLQAAMVANLLVGLFNLLPTIPLDGGMILEAVVWRVTGRRRTGTRVAAGLGRVLAVVVLVWFAVVPLVRGDAVSPFGIMIGLLVASILWRGASQSLRVAGRAERVAGLRADAIVRPGVAVPGTTTVAAALALLAAPAAPGTRDADVLVLLDASGRATAYTTRDALEAVPHEHAGAPATAAATALAPAPPVDADLAGDALFEAVRRASMAPVIVAVRSGRVVGTIAVTDVVAVLGRT